jgi:hypothetical protein
MTCKQTSYLKLTAAAVLERAPKAKSNLGKIWNPFFLSSALWTLVASGWRGFLVESIIRLCSLDSLKKNVKYKACMKYPFFLHFNF